MFYIRDLESKKYIKVWKDNKSKRKWHWRYTVKPFATTFEDKQIKRFYGLLSKKEQGKILYPEYIEKRVGYSTKLLTIACVVVYADVFFLLGLLFMESKQFLKEEPVSIISSPEESFPSFSNSPVTAFEVAREAARERKERVQSLFYSQKNSERIYEAMHIYAKKYEIPISIACALVLTESDGKADAKHSVSNCLGLTQLSLVTAQNQYNKNGYEQKILTDVDVLDIETNLDLGFAYYKWCERQAETIAFKYRFGYDDWDLAYLIYNAGYGNVFKYGCKTYLVDKKNPRSHSAYKAMDRWSEKRKTCKDLFEDFYSFLEGEDYE